MSKTRKGETMIKPKIRIQYIRILKPPKMRHCIKFTMYLTDTIIICNFMDLFYGYIYNHTLKSLNRRQNIINKSISFC